MEHLRLTHLYNGPDTNRTPLDCAKEWKKLGLGNIDSLIKEQLIAVQLRSQGNLAKVTVLDVGSGTEATLMKSIIHDPSVAPETRKYLAQHQNLSLELVAINDAKIQDTFGKVIEAENVNQHDIRAEFKHIDYSLSASQTLRNFLNQQGLHGVHLALGTWSLSYLPPNVFQEVVETVVNNMEPQGRFIGVGYNDNVSGIGFKFHPDRGDIAHFTIKNSYLPDNLWEVLLDEFPENRNSGILRRRKIDDLKSYFLKLIQHPQLRADIDYDQLLLSLQNATSGRDLRIVANALKLGMKKMWEHQFSSKFKPKKDQILDDIEHRDDISVQITKPNLFQIQKK